MSRGKYYTPEFKEQAARKVVEGSLKVAQVARELDVNETTLGCWVTAYEPQAHRVVQHSVRRYDGNATAPPSVKGFGSHLLSTDAGEPLPFRRAVPKLELY